MKELSQYVSFDLEFNQFEGKYHIIQVSAVRFADGQEVAHYDSYAYTDKPLKSFINGLTGITSDKILQAPPTRASSSGVSRLCCRQSPHWIQCHQE